MKFTHIILLLSGIMILLACSSNKELGKHLNNQNSMKQVNSRIHDIWIGIRINGSPLDRMTAAPRLEINLTEMKIFGNDSCNEYSGSIDRVSDVALSFGTIASTRKLCTNMERANTFNQAMTQVVSYRLEGLNLILLDNNGKEVLAFLKGD